MCMTGMAFKLGFLRTRSFCCTKSISDRILSISTGSVHINGGSKWTLTQNPRAVPKYLRLCSTSTASAASTPSPNLASEQAARNFILGLDVNSRNLLQKEIERIDEENAKEELEENPDITISRAALWNVFIYNALPFVGFGLLDNVIMIVAGEYIDATIGAVLGISTMAAAALGNLISDLAGVGTAGYVEAVASKVGVHVPDITPAQSLLSSTRYTVALGRALGVAVGCLLGMFPLLFFDHDKEEEEGHELKIEVKGATTLEKAAQASP